MSKNIKLVSISIASSAVIAILISKFVIVNLDPKSGINNLVIVMISSYICSLICGLFVGIKIQKKLSIKLIYATITVLISVIINSFASLSQIIPVIVGIAH